MTLYRVPKIADPQALSALVVAGSGGAGATTTAWGLATALRLGAVCEVSLVDATSDGGNLLSRTGSSNIDDARALRQFADSMAVTSSGAVVVGADDGPATDPALVDELLAARGTARVHDAGTTVRSQRMIRLIDSGVPLVVTAPARAEPLARLRGVLTWLTDAYSGDFLKDVVVVISHQTPSVGVDLSKIRAALAARTAGVVEVAFDPALARAGVLSHTSLSPSTLDAWCEVLDLLGPLAVAPASREGAPA